MILLTIFCIATLTASLPLIIQKLFPGAQMKKSNNWLPIAASLVYVTAFLLPDIHISKETTTFQQHFVGGGLYCMLLYLYFKKLLGWKINWAIGILVLFAWTSAFGVANEMLEFTLTKLNIAQISTGDTEWDLLANTTGSLVSYLIFIAGKILYKKRTLK